MRQRRRICDVRCWGAEGEGMNNKPTRSTNRMIAQMNNYGNVAVPWPLGVEAKPNQLEQMNSKNILVTFVTFVSNQ